MCNCAMLDEDFVNIRIKIHAIRLRIASIRDSEGRAHYSYIHSENYKHKCRFIMAIRSAPGWDITRRSIECRMF